MLLKLKRTCFRCLVRPLQVLLPLSALFAILITAIQLKMYLNAGNGMTENYRSDRTKTKDEIKQWHPLEVLDSNPQVQLSERTVQPPTDRNRADEEMKQFLPLDTDLQLTARSEQTNNPVTCQTPEDPLFPLCRRKIESFNDNWNAKCHGEKHQVDSSNLCSVIQYLSEVEAWCPVLPWRQDQNPFKSSGDFTKAVYRRNVSGLLEKISDEKYAWMRKRITETWPQWVDAIKELSLTQNIHNRQKKKMLLYMGALEEFSWLFTEAFKGGPLGELTQWSDLMSALYILGHDVIISTDKGELSRILTPADPDGCANTILEDGLDLIFTDITGVKGLSDKSGPHLSRYRCKLRVLDSFGTDAEFNYKFYKEDIPGGGSEFGELNLLLPQFMTMYPHSPDNSFIGFAVPKKLDDREVKGQKGRRAALVYGKKLYFWKGHKEYIDIVKKYLDEIHATFGGDSEQARLDWDVPEYVINHSIVNITTLMTLLQNSKVFVGLGEPFEGPAALEALANGCYFINPKYSPPLDRINSKFFGGKPMDRKVTSQNPYAEVFVGEPFVQTIDIRNMTQVTEAMRKITNSQEIPHLPYEFTVTGMLERLNAYVEYQDFCKPSNWPPSSELRAVIGQRGQSCVFACLDKGLVCEPTFFGAINTLGNLEKAGFSCKESNTLSRDSTLAPSWNTTDNTCLLQSDAMLFSCRATRPEVVRVCPCRSYRKEQVALCKSCLQQQ